MKRKNDDILSESRLFLVLSRGGGHILVPQHSVSCLVRDTNYCLVLLPHFAVTAIHSEKLPCFRRT